MSRRAPGRSAPGRRLMAVAVSSLLCAALPASVAGATSGAAAAVPAANGAPLPVGKPLTPVAGRRITPFELSPGPRDFQKRLSFSPGAGWLGNGRLYAFRLGFNPNRHFGYEMAVGHTPGEAVHALFHSLSVQLRLPMASRLQPYATAGYGMMLVFPGNLVNASAVTKNSISVGGGLEIFVRDDVALRGEMRHRTVIGRDPAAAEGAGGTGADRGGVAYAYREATVGLTFYRSVGRAPAAESSSTGGLEP